MKFSLRLSTADDVRLKSAKEFLCYGGAEANVGDFLSALAMMFLLLNGSPQGIIFKRYCSSEITDEWNPIRI